MTFASIHRPAEGVHPRESSLQGCDSASKKSEFRCPFGTSQRSRLGPKGPRNTNIVAVIPRAAHAFSVLALGWYVSRFQRVCRFAAREIVTGGKAFRQRAFALKSVNAMNERLLSESLSEKPPNDFCLSRRPSSGVLLFINRRFFDHKLAITAKK